MTVNKYRFSNNGIERKLQIPIEITWYMEGRTDSIDVYEQEVVEQIVNPPEDFEVTRFEHQLWTSGTTQRYDINYDFYFLSSNVDISAATSNDWVIDYEDEGFSVLEMYYYSNAFKNSFFKIDFYDTTNAETQKNYFTIILPTQQGEMMTKSLNSKNVEVRKPKYNLDYVGDKEGFFVYWLKSRDYINLDEFYMSCKFFNAKSGQFIRMTNEPQANFGDKYNFQKSQKFYYKLILDYDNYDYRVETVGGTRVGIQTPINFYEYINP